jgi:hypothetical protein
VTALATMAVPQGVLRASTSKVTVCRALGARLPTGRGGSAVSTPAISVVRLACTPVLILSPPLYRPTSMVSGPAAGPRRALLKVSVSTSDRGSPQSPTSWVHTTMRRSVATRIHPSQNSRALSMRAASCWARRSSTLSPGRVTTTWASRK